jgi:hypothetical protein
MTTTEPTKTRPGDQPLPIGGHECVQDALIADIRERRDIGIQRYGSALMTHNGRDAVQDAIEEAVDLAVYLKQVALETRDRQAEVEQLRAEVAAARKFAAEMRDFCSPHAVAADYADRLLEAMDRALKGGTPAGSGLREVLIRVHAPTDENAAQWAQTIRDLVVAEHGQDMRLNITITPEEAR